MDKKEIRSAIIKKLNEITAYDRNTKSKQIIDQLIATPEWNNANTIATTMPMEHEIDTTLFIQACWRLHKDVVVPKCIHKTKEMQFFKITSFEQLEKGYFGIQEPNEFICEKINKDEINLIVVPGVAYTSKGDRLGYGGGYYDRYLSDYAGNLVALAYDLQIVEELPIEAHDQRMPLIITETNIIKTL
ncbi:5-formyltetrahydrofolate cyclo-ligase [Gottfriedia solisilvae]|uniref:5-formyltetrahydrofolate cyclo-ligase n=1 Tax=Gottfriedia solisilvae TaxID=1516104 RepID=UPI003D2F41BE